MSDNEPNVPENETSAAKTLTARDQHDAVRNRYASIAQTDPASYCGTSLEENSH